MVSVETRTYEKDHAVRLRASSTSSEAAPAETRATEAVASPSSLSSAQRWPAWVADASSELSGGEVKAAIIVREGFSSALKNLWLDVGPEVLKVGLPDESTLSLPLPAAVDTDALPVAKLSEKSRTLKVRLTVRS